MYMERRRIWFRYLCGIPLFILGAALSSMRGAEGSVFSCCVFLLLAGTECVLLFRESGKILDLRIILSLSWLTAIALSVLKLSALQSPWGIRMWASAGGFYFIFTGCYDLFHYFSGKEKKNGQEQFSETGNVISEEEERKRLSSRVMEAMLILSALGLVCFVPEWIKFYREFGVLIPALSDQPHAYTSFHITGLHYFVVSLMLVHPLTVIYVMNRKPGTKDGLLLVLLNGFSIAVSVILLSKTQLIFDIALPLIVWVILQKRFSAKKLAAFVISGGVLAVIMAMALMFSRHYPEGYLKSIFCFKKQETPVALQYPYIYIVNNLENLNLLIENMTGFTFGKRQLYPFLALSGLKFVPAVQIRFLIVEHFYTVTELNTLSLIYDAFGDFGIAGVFLFAALLGAISERITASTERKRSVFCLLLYAQFAVYLGLAFFSTWFSNPTVWFWFAASFMISLWCTRTERLRFHIRKI